VQSVSEADLDRTQGNDSSGKKELTSLVWIVHLSLAREDADNRLKLAGEEYSRLINSCKDRDDGANLDRASRSEKLQARNSVGLCVALDIT
jgi:hypothetical protein